MYKVTSHFSNKQRTEESFPQFDPLRQVVNEFAVKSVNNWGRRGITYEQEIDKLEWVAKSQFINVMAYKKQKKLWWKACNYWLSSGFLNVLQMELKLSPSLCLSFTHTHTHTHTLTHTHTHTMGSLGQGERGFSWSLM